MELQISVVLTSDPASVGTELCEMRSAVLSRLPPAALEIYPWRKLIPNRELGEINPVLSCTHIWSYHLAEVGKRGQAIDRSWFKCHRHLLF